MARSIGVRQGKAGLVLGILFGSVFAAVGIGVLVFVVLPTLSDALAARSWAPTRAIVESANLERSHGSKSIVYRVTARYRYSVDGIEHDGERVGLIDGSDNIGDWHERWYRSLQRALESGESIEIYVDPKDPTRSIVDRQIRWGQLGLFLIFPLAFGGAGLGIVAASVLGFRKNRRQEAERAALAAQGDGRISFRQGVAVPSDGAAGLVALWLVAAIWCAISTPAAILALDEGLRGENRLALLVLIFPVVGVGLLVGAIRRQLEWRRFGRLSLVMDPYPGAIGGEMAGTLEIPISPGPDRSYRATLACLESRVVGTGKGRRRRETLVWQTEGVPQASACPKGTRLAVRFRIPAGLPPSESPSRDYRCWRLTLEGSLPGVDLERSFEIEMQPGDARSSALSTVPLSDDQAPPPHIPRSLLRMSESREGKVFDFPPGRQLGIGLPFALAGLICTGIAIFIAQGAGTTALAILLVAGVPMLLGGLWVALNGLRVIAGYRGVTVERRLLGIPISRQSAGRDQLLRIAREQGATSSNGSRTTVWYRLDLHTRDGRKLRIADGLKGERLAREVGSRLALALGLPDTQD